MYARCTGIVSEREVDQKARCWGSDNVHCPMNTLTVGTMLTEALTYVLQCTQCT